MKRKNSVYIYSQHYTNIQISEKTTALYTNVFHIQGKLIYHAMSRKTIKLNQVDPASKPKHTKTLSIFPLAFKITFIGPFRFGKLHRMITCQSIWKKLAQNRIGCQSSITKHRQARRIAIFGYNRGGEERMKLCEIQTEESSWEKFVMLQFFFVETILCALNTSSIILISLTPGM